MVDKEKQLHNLRHTAAHICAQAVTELFPGTKLTIGPVTETGFFYDVLPPRNLKESDLPAIDARMRELIAKNFKIVGGQVPKEEARKLFAGNNFKQELIEEIPGETVGVYYQGDWYDLCRGGHAESLGEVKFFKLTGISGSYWRANREGTALQRLTGVAFMTQEEMDAHFKAIEDAELYDHRRLGKQLELFSFHDEAPGMPFFHSKGLLIYNGLINYLRRLRGQEYQEIRTPVLLDESLWKMSGHYDFYKNNMYFTRIDEGNACVKPMNCPGSLLLFKEKPHSYRELPMRLAEFGHVHRHELSGVLHGLFRVRTFTIDDAHLYCTVDQIEQEIDKALALAKRVYKAFGFTKVMMGLSTRPEKSMGSDENWEKATSALRNALEKQGLGYVVQEGEGAFYGPKIEMKIEDAMGRSWQCGTVQVDFNMPINFDIEYIAADQSRQRPVMVHVAIYGSLERFMGVILEHFKGRLPYWISPVQVRVLTITDELEEYAREVLVQLQAAGVRAELDVSHDQISGQIRKAQVDKIPFMIVLGKKEQAARTVTLRDLDGKQEFGLTVGAVLERLKKLEEV